MKLLKLFLLLTLFQISLIAQTIYVPVESKVYDFLETLSMKRVITVDDMIRPLSRVYIFTKLLEAKNNINNLSSIQKEELENWLNKFSFEEKYFSEYNGIEKYDVYEDDDSPIIQILKSNNALPVITNDFQFEKSSIEKAINNLLQSATITNSKDLAAINLWLSNYQNQKKFGNLSLPRKSSEGIFWGNKNHFSIGEFFSNRAAVNFDFMGGAEAVNYDKNTYLKHKYGNKLFGYLNNNIGFNLNLLTNHEWQKDIDRRYEFTDHPAVEVQERFDGKGIGYLDYNMNLSFDWTWGTFTLGKNAMNFGYGKGGNVILGNRAPAFPFIRLDVKPAKWISMNYYHGWLVSTLKDSNRIYSDGLGGKNIFDRSKYIASHSLRFNFFSDTQFLVGESVVYSDQMEFSFLVPIMIFTFFDRHQNINNSKGSLGSNLQLFFSLITRDIFPNTQFFSSLFWDEIATTNLFDTKKQRLQLGFNIGGSITDFIINNIRLDLEYSRINPFAYQHTTKATDYRNSDYLLGHWIGQNSDILFVKLNYKFTKSFQLDTWIRNIRRGEPGSVFDQYYTQPQPAFLFGKKTYYLDYGANITYEFFTDLTTHFNYSSRTINKENNSGQYSKTKIDDFSFGIYYGLGL